MPDIFPVLNILTIIIGLITTIMVIRLYLTYRFKYILTFAFNISLFNVVLISFLPVNYLLGNSSANNGQTFLILTILYLFLISINILKYLWGYTFILIFFQLLRKTLSKSINLGFLSTAVATLIIFTGLFFFGPVGEGTNYPRKISEIITFQALIGAYAALIYFYIKVKKIETGKKLAAIKMYSFPLIIIWSYLFISSSVGTFVNLPTLVEVNIILTAVSFNLNTAVVLKRFIEYYGDAGESGPKKALTLDELFKKYNISNREQEIILLISRGKSNQQIADELFISIATVKDHVYNIFKKTAVKSRVQLLNLFR